MAISRSSRTLPSMAAAYCLGVFNDNYFKQTAMLLAISAGLNQLQGWAAMLFALPFILFSAAGGWCADRFPKRYILIASKGIELIAMLTGAIGLLTGSWPLILTMLFIMGLQSAFFGPSLHGTIPELFDQSQVPKVNALFKLLSTLAILSGMAAAGFSLDFPGTTPSHIPSGIILVSAIIVAVSVLGLLASMGIKKHRHQTTEKATFPWAGPLVSMKNFRHLLKDRDLGLAIAADTWFYFLASTLVLVINSFGLTLLGLSQTLTSMLSVALMAGVCCGSLLAARLFNLEYWHRHLPYASLALSSTLLLAGVTPLLPANIQLYWFAVALTATGVAGGLFIIPITSFLQLRPAEHEKGKTIATAGFSSFCAILLSGFLYAMLESVVTPSHFMIVLGILSLITTAILFLFINNTDHSLLSRLLKVLLAVRYDVTVKGLDDLDLDQTRGTIFLPNHPALVDPLIVMSAVHGKFAPRPLSAEEQVNKPVVRQLMRSVNPIILPKAVKGDTSTRESVRQAINEVIHTLKGGDNILFYPAGRLTRSAFEDLRGNSGLEFINRAIPDLQVVLVRTTGLWGSTFSHASGKPPSLTGQIKLYIQALLLNGVFLLPKRQVCVEFRKDTKIQKLDNRREINNYLEGWYNEASSPATATPYFWWQKSQPGPGKDLAVRR